MLQSSNLGKYRNQTRRSTDMGLNENGDVLGRGGARLAWHQRVLDRLTDSAWAIFDAVESYAARPHPRRAASMHARARAGGPVTRRRYA